MKNVQKCIPYLSGIFSKLSSNCPNIRIPLANLTIYASILSKKVFFLNLMPKKGGDKIALHPLHFSKWGGQ